MNSAQMGPMSGRVGPLFSLLPWRWSHWLLLVVGPLFVVMYLTLLSWEPLDEAFQGLGSRPLVSAGSVGYGGIRLEAFFGFVMLLLLTPLVGIVALFLLLFAMVILASAVGPVVRMLGLPDWAFILLVGALSSSVVYAKSDLWLPWSLSLLDRVATAYLLPFL